MNTIKKLFLLLPVLGILFVPSMQAQDEADIDYRVAIKEQLIRIQGVSFSLNNSIETADQMKDLSSQVISLVQGVDLNDVNPKKMEKLFKRLLSFSQINDAMYDLQSSYVGSMVDPDANPDRPFDNGGVKVDPDVNPDGKGNVNPSSQADKDALADIDPRFVKKTQKYLQKANNRYISLEKFISKL